MIGGHDLLGTWGPLVCLCLFAGMMLLHELGRRLGVRRRAKDPEGSRLGLGPVESATFGLLGLLIAFTFSGAASRFDVRRNLVTEEANLIEQAWLRVDLLPEAEQPKMRGHFRDYLDSRLAVYDKLPDLKPPTGNSTARDGCSWRFGMVLSPRPDTAAARRSAPICFSAASTR